MRAMILASIVPLSLLSNLLGAHYHKMRFGIQDTLLQVSGGWEEQLQALLFQSGDPSSYVDDLLGQSLCACNESALELKGRFTLQQHSSQLEVSCTQRCPASTQAAALN